MRHTVPWSVKGVDHDAREAAKEAARRSGMSLGEWLNTMIVDRAEPVEDPSGLSSVARRLESLTQKLDAASRRGSETAIPRSQAGGDTTEIVRALDAVARLAELSERRSAAAIEAVERMSSVRPAEPRMASPPLAPAIVADPARSATQSQLEEIARSIRGINDGPRDAPATPRRKTFNRDIESAVAEIAARQRALDLPPAAPASAIPAPAARGTDFGPLEERLDALSRRIDTILNAQPAGETSRDSAKIAAEIGRLSQQIDTIARPSGDGLEREIRTLATRIEAMRAEMGQQREQMSAGRAMAEVRADLAEINQRIGSLAPRQSVETLEFEIQSLGERLADVRAQGIPAEGLEWLVAEFERTVAGLTPAEGIVEEVRALSRKLESARLYGLDPADAGELIEETRAIRGMLAETASRASVEALADQVARLGDRIDALPLEQPAPQGEQLAAALEARIEEITARIEQAARHAAPPAVAASNPELEDALRRLADKLDGSSAGAGDPKALADIERHIVSLAAKIDATDQRFTQLGTIERGLSDLFVQMEEMRASAIEAAERAARSAVAGRGSPDVDALKREIDTLRHGQAETEQRARGAVDAVQETLERVARRIAEIETAPAPAAAPAPVAATEAAAPAPRAVRIAARPEERAAPASPAAVQKSAESATPARMPAAAAPPRPSGQVDQPLEPGSGAPRLRPPAPGAGQAASKGDFIAAARRAAQAAAEASQSPRPAARDASDKTAKTSLFSRLRGSGKVATDEPVADLEAAPASRQARGAAPAVVTGPSIVDHREPEAEAEAGPTLGEKLAANRKTIVMGIAAALLVVAAGVSTLSNLRSNANLSTPDTRAPRSAPDVTETPAAPAAAETPAQTSQPAAPATAPSSAVPPADAPVQPPAPGSSQVDDQAPLTTGSLSGAARPVAAAAPGTTVSPTGWQSAAARPAERPQTLPPALRAAADSGNPVAAYDLATRHLEGRGVPVSAAEAAKWYQRAADAGLAPAQYRLGSLYEKGTGVVRDLNRARTLYERAAEAGNGKAMHNLAVIFAQGVQGDRPDYRNAANWFRRAANHGVTDSQFNLGILYARGLGVDQSLAESYKWFSLAANGGDQDAAKKRDEVAGRLDAQTLVAARLAVQTFTARPEPDAAVRVALPADGWGETPGQAAPRRAQATQR